MYKFNAMSIYKDFELKFTINTSIHRTDVYL